MHLNCIVFAGDVVEHETPADGPMTYNQTVFDRSRAAVVEHSGRVEPLYDVIGEHVCTDRLQADVVRTAGATPVTHHHAHNRNAAANARYSHETRK